MHTVPTAVVGASGYSGLELTRLLSRHPRVRLIALHSDRWSGEAAGARVPLPEPAASLRYRALSEAAALEADLAFLATPAEVSLDLAPRLCARGVRVVDLSGAFRLADPAAYPAWYGFEHTAPALLAEAVYALPELSRARLAALHSDRWSGEAAGARVPLPEPAASLRYLALSEAGSLEAELAFLATPAEVSLALAP
ncbi:MAG TPA: hypothetical protein VFF02_18265, partial [Anaeromyxobacteraceae bacterium]|nr:hypothetical protein [Anaeromyxobacteraceae bacterium]